MKHTAVEFLSKSLFNILQEAEENNILEVGTQNFKRYIEMFTEQAKEMEKEQIMNAFEAAEKDCGRDFLHGDLYYNETFKSE